MQQPHGLFWSLFEQSDKASVRLLRYELQTPPEAVRAMMSLDAGEQALALERLYLIDGTPVAFCEDWLHPRAATVSRARANFISTEDILHEVGFRVTQTETVIRAEMPNERIKGILELGRDSAVMAMHRSAFVEDGTAKEIARSWFCSDGYELCFSSRDQGARTGPLSVRSIEKTRRP